MKTLIADDFATNREIVASIVKEYGEVVSVADGFQAITEFESAHKHGDPFDLVCLDIEMPYLDGISALFSIRDIEIQENFKKSVIFMITGSKDITNILDSFQGKADEFIIKDSAMKNRLLIELKKYNLI
jgi:two-component system chemotaxis response regulator CheY